MRPIEILSKPIAYAHGILLGLWILAPSLSQAQGMQGQDSTSDARHFQATRISDAQSPKSPPTGQFTPAASTRQDPWTADRNPNALLPPPLSSPSTEAQATTTPSSASPSNWTAPVRGVHTAPPSPQSVRQPQSIHPEKMTRVSGVQTASYVNEPTTAFDPSNTSQELKDAPESSTDKLALRPPSPKSAGNIAAPKSQWSSVVSMVTSLLLVIGLFLGLAWMMRKSSLQSNALLPKEVVQVLGRTTMAPRQQLYVLRFGNRLILVTHQLGQTETICEIDDPLEVDRIAGLCEQNSNGSVTQSFRHVLQQVSNGGISRNTATNSSRRSLSS